MKLAILTVFLITTFIKFAELSAASEPDYSDDVIYNYDDQINLITTEEPEENAETNFTQESHLNGNESFKESNDTTLLHSLPKTGESEAKQIYSEVLDPDECGDPPFVKNALIFEGKQVRYEVGAKVTYACEFGYITDGSVHSSKCLLSDDSQTLYWTDPETRCSPRSCGDPGYVSHAHREGSVFTFPNKVSFVCDDGYVLRGYGIRYCQTSGTWSGNLPTCEPIFCDPPENPENGKVSYSSLGFESELHYECAPGFILKNDQGRICSGSGTWTGNEPICQEAQCDQPTAPEHGTVQIIGDKSSAGSRALYTCDDGRVLYGSASSKCLDTGEWTFPTPKCLEPCFIPKMEHGKIGRYVFYYRRRFEELSENSNIEDGEELYLRCEEKYEPFGNPEKEVRITCAHGKWEAEPICKPAMCRGQPPPTQHGSLARANRTHGGGVVYHCNNYAKKDKYGNVTCVFGNWKGVTPVCKDLRCSVNELVFPGLVKGHKKLYSSGQKLVVTCEPGFNLTKDKNELTCIGGTWKGHLPPCIAVSCRTEDLAELKDVVLEGEKSVMNGYYLKVRCRDGFTPSGKQARCYRGQWTIEGALCRESNCILHHIQNGGFSERVQKTQLKWNLRYNRWYEYTKLPLGKQESPGSSVYVSCDDGYTFQGKGEKHVSVRCSRGKWDPDPVCLINGTPYRNEAKVYLEKSENSNAFESTTKQTIIMTTESSDINSDVDQLKNLNSTPYPSCFCTYPSVDDSLVAFVGTEKLSYGSKVKNNDRIKFHCQYLGYSRLNGAPEIKCENCRSWNSFEFPNCALPKVGDTILNFEGNYEILPGGIIGIPEGKKVNIQCMPNGIKDFPTWSVAPKELNFLTYQDSTGRYIHLMEICNASSQHNGQYLCHMKGYRPSAIRIQVISPSMVNCSKLDDREFIIHYDKEQAVNSSAIFSCKNKKEKLDGPSVLTCLSNGQWSGQPPKCKKTCSRINETEGMTISYTNDLQQGSIAAFHCLEPRTHLGVSRATCKENGEWSEPPAKCLLPSCSVEQLFMVVPENVVPIIDDETPESLPYNFSVRLSCEDNMMLSGIDVAKCGQNGMWQLSKLQCISGCVFPRTERSELIIEPDKSFYRFGELVSLSCSPGYVLNSEVVRLMCLGTSWSEGLPGCLKE